MKKTKTLMALTILTLTIFSTNILCGCAPVVYTDSGVIINDGREAENLHVELTGYEKWLLMEIMNAEAEDQSVRGMALVGRVVLNRRNRDGLGIEEVIYAPGQFYTAGMSARYPNPKCELALMWLEWGWDESEGALYFNKGGWSGWVIHEGDHYFYDQYGGK